jgi:2-C-methyl-D-erythritol 2,4-cyclodiphosphate synthase
VSDRVGIGFDSHRFTAGRPLRLGGITVPHTHGLAGHSDGDAAIHAIVDALLGSAALGDIGQHFRDDDPRWKGLDSTVFLKGAREILAAKGLEPAQVDVTILCEHPKLAAHVPAMREATAKGLGLPVEAVSFKAKTNEGMGWVGRREGIGAIAVATTRALASP